MGCSQATNLLSSYINFLNLGCFLLKKRKKLSQSLKTIRGKRSIIMKITNLEHLEYIEESNIIGGSEPPSPPSIPWPDPIPDIPPMPGVDVPEPIIPPEPIPEPPVPN